MCIISKNCNGDIRHAINSLQFFSVGENQPSSQKSSQGKKTKITIPNKKKKEKKNDDNLNL